MATNPSLATQGRGEALRRYYTIAGPLIANALQSRVDWLKALDDVIDEFDKRGINAGRVKASLVGAQYNSLFERYMQAFVRLQTPPGAEDFHQRWLSWIQRLVRANFCLGEGASRSDFHLLEEACTTLEEARPLLSTVTRITAALAPDLMPTDPIRERSPVRTVAQRSAGPAGVKPGHQPAALKGGTPARPAPAPAAKPEPSPIPGGSGIKVAAKQIDTKKDAKQAKRRDQADKRRS